jgi:EpsI family protein
MLVIASGPAAARVLRSEGRGQAVLRPPVVSGPWTTVGDQIPTWSPRFINPRAEYVQSYQSEGDVVKLYAALYDTLQPGVNMTSSANTLFADPGWWQTDQRERTIEFGRTSLQFTERTLRSDQSSLRVWSWYEIDGRTTGERYVAKLLLAKAGLLGARGGCRALAVATEVMPDVEPDSVLRQFVAHLTFSDARQVAMAESGNDGWAPTALPAASTRRSFMLRGEPRHGAHANQ